MIIWWCTWHLYVTSLMTCCSACTTTQFNEYNNVSINNVKYEVIIKWTTYQVTISPWNWSDCLRTTSLSLISTVCIYCMYINWHNWHKYEYIYETMKRETIKQQNNKFSKFQDLQCPHSWLSGLWYWRAPQSNHKSCKHRKSPQANCMAMASLWHAALPARMPQRNH